MGVGEPKDPTVIFDRRLQPVKSGTQLALLAGFGGLLALMAFVGIDSIGALGQVQLRNVQIRQTFLVRNRALEQIRSAVYQSGTYARDYLLERDPLQADVYRNGLQQARNQAEEALDTYSRSVERGDSEAFQALATEIRDFWNTLDPIFHWDEREKRRRMDSYLREQLFPRRATTLQIADKIGAVNEGELSTGDQELEAIFNRFRKRLMLMLSITLALGLVLAGVTMHHILRLARAADLRYREIVQAQGALKELSARLVEAQEQERRAISRELHDEVGQSLSALLMELGNLSAVAPADNPELRGHLDAIRQLAEGSVSVVRNMSLLLRPSMLDDLGLMPALQWQAREISKRTGMDVKVNAESVADDLPEEYRTCIYRVVQEALHNCARHAAAGKVRIQVLQDPQKILLRVEDDGRGFDPLVVKGLGLLGIEERVTHLGGTFHIESQPARGTSLSVKLPLSERLAKVAG